MIYRKYVKRPLDFILSLLALIILSPVLLIVAILVRTKLGSPVIFKQKRPGLNENIFTLYKFRTMTDEKDKTGNLLSDEIRLTKFGKLLRSTSLDELPELWNILKGDMSIVGPRPLAVQYLPYYTEEERHRHDVRPGLTGYAQVSGRNFLHWDERFKIDLIYIEKVSFLFDLKILFLTLYKVVKRSDIGVRGEAEIIDFNTYRERAEGEDMQMKEIGSDFHWETLEYIQEKKYEDTDFLKFFLLGRNALEYILEDIYKKKNKISSVYFPSYACDSMLQPFIRRNIEVKIYDVLFNENGTLDFLLNDENVDVLFAMNYFGFNSCKFPEEHLEHFKNKGAIIIEDITHSLFLKTPGNKNSDYMFGSIRKWIPVISGAFAYSRIGFKDDIEIFSASDVLIKNKKIAMKLKADYLMNKMDSKEEILNMFEQINCEIDNVVEIQQIDKESMSILNAYNFTEMIRKRKSNTKTIEQLLLGQKKIGLINKIGNDDCPLFYPIFIENRNEVRSVLINDSCFCPFHWPKPDYDFLQSNMYLSEISLICDQRYETRDMENQIRILMKSLAKKEIKS